MTPSPKPETQTRPVNLDDIRRQIDEIDQTLLDMLSRRAELVHAVGIV